MSTGTERMAGQAPATSSCTWLYRAVELIEYGWRGAMYGRAEQLYIPYLTLPDGGVFWLRGCGVTARSAGWAATKLRWFGPSLFPGQEYLLRGWVRSHARLLPLGAPLPESVGESVSPQVEEILAELQGMARDEQAWVQRWLMVPDLPEPEREQLMTLLALVDYFGRDQPITPAG